MRFPGFYGEWEETRLGEVSEKINSGKTPLGGETTYRNIGVLFIRSQNVNNDRLDVENPVFISEQINAGMKNSIVRANDILLNITGASLGRSCVVPNDFEIGNVNQHVCIIRLKKGYNSKFIQPIFSSEKGQAIFESLQTGSGREGLNFESIKHIALYFPTSTEQQKIADFLSLISERIETQNKIIEELQTLMHCLREQIFKQKLKFNNQNATGFDNWQTKKLGEICEINPPNLSLPNSFTYIDLESVNGGTLIKKERILKENAPSRAQRVLKKGDVLFQMVRPYQKNNFYFDFENDYVASTGYAQIRTTQNARFIFHYLHFQEFVDKVIERCTGTSYPAINSTDLANIFVQIPLLPEQTHVANFLFIIDKKIETEKKLLSQFHKQKEFLLARLFI